MIFKHKWRSHECLKNILTHPLRHTWTEVVMGIPVVTNSRNLTTGEELVIEKAAAVQKGPAKRLLNLQPSGKAKARR